jgi:hypothetical protein
MEELAPQRRLDMLLEQPAALLWFQHRRGRRLREKGIPAPLQRHGPRPV